MLITKTLKKMILAGLTFGGHCSKLGIVLITLLILVKRNP